MKQQQSNRMENHNSELNFAELVPSSSSLQQQQRRFSRTKTMPTRDKNIYLKNENAHKETLTGKNANTKWAEEDAKIITGTRVMDGDNENDNNAADDDDDDGDAAAAAAVASALAEGVNGDSGGGEYANKNAYDRHHQARRRNNAKRKLQQHRSGTGEITRSSSSRSSSTIFDAFDRGGELIKNDVNMFAGALMKNDDATAVAAQKQLYAMLRKDATKTCNCCDCTKCSSKTTDKCGCCAALKLCSCSMSDGENDEDDSKKTTQLAKSPRVYYTQDANDPNMCCDCSELSTMTQQASSAAAAAAIFSRNEEGSGDAGDEVNNTDADAAEVNQPPVINNNKMLLPLSAELINGKKANSNRDELAGKINFFYCTLNLSTTLTI